MRLHADLVSWGETIGFETVLVVIGSFSCLECAIVVIESSSIFKVRVKGVSPFSVCSEMCDGQICPMTHVSCSRRSQLHVLSLIFGIYIPKCHGDSDLEGILDPAAVPDDVTLEASLVLLSCELDDSVLVNIEVVVASFDAFDICLPDFPGLYPIQRRTIAAG